MKRLTTLVLAGALLGAASGATAREWGGMYVPLDETDLELLSQAADRVDAAGGDQPVTWENPKNGTRGSIQAARRFERTGVPCVQYRLRIEVSGYEPFVSSPALCQTSEGWKLMSKGS